MSHHPHDAENTVFFMVIHPDDREKAVNYVNDVLKEAGYSNSRTLVKLVKSGSDIMLALGIEDVAVDISIDEMLKKTGMYTAMPITPPVPATKAPGYFDSEEYRTEVATLIDYRSTAAQEQEIETAVEIAYSARPDLAPLLTKDNLPTIECVGETIVVSGISSPTLYKRLTDALCKVGFVEDKTFKTTKTLRGVISSNQPKEIIFERENLRKNPGMSHDFLCAVRAGLESRHIRA